MRRPAVSLSKPHIRLIACSCSVLSFFLGGPSKISADPVYSIVNLGSLGSGAAITSDMNNSGAAVGFVTNASGDQIPVTFNGQVSSLGGYGQANGINDAGTIIGTQLVNNSPSVTEWVNGQASSLNISGYGTGINNSGQAVGGYITASGQLHAFTCSNGTMIDLGTLPGGTWSSAYGVNSLGGIVGTSALGNGLFSAFVSNGTGVTNLGTFQGSNGSSYGMAINDSGEAVGNAQTAQGYSHAFAWLGGSLVDLGTLGGTQSYAYAVNGSGTVVGYSLMSDNSSHGFADWNGVMLDLNSLLPIGSDWTIDAAYGINSGGDILGTGTLDGQMYAIELQPSYTDNADAVNAVAPIPEPASLLLGTVGAIAIALVLRLRRRTSAL